MEVYPIKSEGKNGNRKFPMHRGNTEEFIRRYYNFYLKGEFGNRYRLYAKEAHLIDDFRFFNGVEITKKYTNGQPGNKPGWNKKEV